ncbi:serine/threonine-protein kinase [Streptomyces sp. CC208A]|uniref:serine/threonine-protein kinase n=1 Tax=Streptomyces sp. CC208A TaxID=3044573 RepID=UPI0024A81784|nr:serine/threonine-protein kinase [Streptomyces sp. CC208A]
MSTSDDDGRPLVDGRFRLVSRLGSGGMGTVWRARDIALDRDVALKEVRPPDPAVEAANPGLTAQLRARAVREARALARLSHPHVVTVHHIVEPADGSAPWIVMELVEGSSVADRLAAGPLPVPEAITLGRQILGALRAAHAAGIQHRDVKPANVLLRAEGGAVLTDFGIAVLDEATSRLTASGDLIGSAEFIAPERVRGEEGNPASDLWSLGMLLYVATEGHHPLRRATSLATVVAVLDDPIPPPVRSGALAPVLTRLLVRDPAQRPDGAELDRLLAEAQGAPAGAPDPRATPADAAPQGFGPPTPPPTPAPGPYPYAHPVYQPPVPPPTVAAGRATAAPARRRRLTTAVAGTVLAAGLVALGFRFLPLGGEGTEGAGDRTPDAKGGTTASRTPGSTTAPTPAESSAPPAVTGSLLTPDNTRAVIAAFREATGTTTFKELYIYDAYAFAGIPTKPGAKTYDRYQYRDGKVGKQGVGGTISSSRPDDQPFDVTRLPWDDLPTLMKRADRELKVENPNLRYVIVDRWSFNEDRPTLRVYRTNEYGAVGYLAVDADGRVVHKVTAD